jgi:hypothetical protein
MCPQPENDPQILAPTGPSIIMRATEVRQCRLASYTHVCSPGSGKLFGSEFDFFAFMALKEANFPRFSDAGAHCDKWHRKFTLAANGAVPAHVGHRSAPQIAGGSAIAGSQPPVPGTPNR